MSSRLDPLILPRALRSVGSSGGVVRRLCLLRRCPPCLPCCGPSARVVRVGPREPASRAGVRRQCLSHLGPQILPLALRLVDCLWRCVRRPCSLRRCLPAVPLASVSVNRAHCAAFVGRVSRRGSRTASRAGSSTVPLGPDVTSRVGAVGRARHAAARRLCLAHRRSRPCLPRRVRRRCRLPLMSPLAPVPSAAPPLRDPSTPPLAPATHRPCLPRRPHHRLALSFPSPVPGTHRPPHTHLSVMRCRLPDDR